MQRQVIYSIQLHPSLPGLSKYNHTEESNNSTVLTSKGLNLWLLLSRFSRVRLCATPWTTAYQASPSVGFSRQEHWSGLPFPFPMHESRKWKGSRSVVSDSYRPHGLQPTRLLHPWDLPGESTGVGCIDLKNTFLFYHMRFFFQPIILHICIW